MGLGHPQRELEDGAETRGAGKGWKEGNTFISLGFSRLINLPEFEMKMGEEGLGSEVEKNSVQSQSPDSRELRQVLDLRSLDGNEDQQPD